jgi:glycosyltransferase involved in cell wall biosynthesis
MNHTNYPEVTVVMAVRNEELHVESAVKSILDQEGVSLELIVVDDNSTDMTHEILLQLSGQEPRMRMVRNPKIGKCAAFNLGVAEASGRFICIFAGDDIMPAGSLHERWRSISNESDEQCMVGLSKLVTMSEIKKFNGHLIPRGRGRAALSGVSPLMNRKAASQIFPTPEQLPNEDTWMELAVLHMPGWRIVHGNTVCCQWRVHSGNSINMSLSFSQYNQRITARMEALRLFMEKFGTVLDIAQREALQKKIDIESARRRGSWFGVLTAGGLLVDRLRALSVTNAAMYELRRRFFGLLSGW